MGSFVDALGSGFERLLRWLYPGALFLVLLFLSNPTVLPNISKPLFVLSKANEVVGIWQVGIVAIVAGMTTYLIHAYIFNQIISWWFCSVGLLHRKSEDLSRIARNLAEFADHWTEPAWRRWGVSSNDQHALERFNNWLTYSWSTYHAGCITLWLTASFFFINEDGSALDTFAKSGGLLLPIGACLLFLAFLLSLLWQYLILTRLTLRLARI
ncbi:MAG: hypothetical protein HYU85_03080 [Chloroflexi bacterium]|nr:hypothetical protein [Chloroflexota bacterium]MBI3930561.1 hypothetical protein [Chloroflexota bacterium]